MTHTALPASVSDRHPEDPELAVVEPHPHGARIRLPPAFARATLDHLAAHFGGLTYLIGPAKRPDGTEIPAGSWALAGDLRVFLAIAFAPDRVAEYWEDLQGNPIYTYRLNEVVVRTRVVPYILRALEAVKPERLDAAGVPAPWVPPRERVDPDLVPEDRDQDALVLAPGAPLAPATPPRPAAPDDPFIDDATIAEWFGRAADMAGFWPHPELSLERGERHRLGFVSGKVWFERRGAVRRVALTTCPNADLAEIIATIVHELAHPYAHLETGSTAHDLPMKKAMVSLAGLLLGDTHFAAVRERLKEPMPAVDAWLATCIRAALRKAPPPAARPLDDDQTARLLGRLKKLRQLAADQLGRPEGISATAAANDLVTIHELGLRGVELAAFDPEQLVDRWVNLEDNAVWRRSLLHGVAAHFDVFSLSIQKKQRMHIFGAYSDVVAAVYLFEVSQARIDRACEAHIAAWKRAVGKTNGGQTRSEKVSFCDSAVVEFRKKLEAIRREEGRGEASDALETAEEFAFVEHARRGRGWSSGGTRTYRLNAAGTALGRSMEVLHGVDGGGPSGYLE